MKRGLSEILVQIVILAGLIFIAGCFTLLSYKYLVILGNWDLKMWGVHGWLYFIATILAILCTRAEKYIKKDILDKYKKKEDKGKAQTLP